VTTWWGDPPIVHSRTRVQNLKGPVTGTSINGYKANPPQQPSNWTVTTTSDEGFRTGFQRITKDIVIPQFEIRSKRGEIFNNPFNTVLTERRDSAPPSWSWQYLLTAGPGGQISGSGGNTRGTFRDPEDHITYPWPEVDVLNLRVSAGTKARAGVAEPEFDMPVFAAESRETFKFLARPAEGLRDYIVKADKAFKKKHRMSMAEAWATRARLGRDALTSTWLAIRWGLKPLCSDFEDALKILREEPKHEKKRYTSRATVRSNPISYEIQDPDTTSDWVFTAKRTRHYKRNVTCRAGVLYEFDTQMASRTGLTLTALPRAAWNAIPMSHIVDWLFNVEDLLASLELRAGVNILSSWSTVTDVREKKFEVWGCTPKIVNGYSIGGSVEHYTHVVETEKDRQNWADIGLTRTPVVFDLSKEKWRNRTLDALALVTSTAFGRSRALR